MGIVTWVKEKKKEETNVMFIQDAMRPPVPPIPNTNNNSPNLASRATNIVPVKGTINVESIALSDDEKAYMSQRDGNDERQTYLSDSGGSSSTGSSSAANGYQNKSSAPQTNGHLSSGSNGSEGNFQSLDSLMADLGNMVTTKSPGNNNITERGGDLDDNRVSFLFIARSYFPFLIQ